MGCYNGMLGVKLEIKECGGTLSVGQPHTASNANNFFNPLFSGLKRIHSTPTPAQDITFKVHSHISGSIQMLEVSPGIKNPEILVMSSSLT